MLKSTFKQIPSSLRHRGFNVVGVVLRDGKPVASTVFPSQEPSMAIHDALSLEHHVDCDWSTDVSAETLAYIDALLLALSDEEDHRLLQQAERAPYGPVR